MIEMYMSCIGIIYVESLASYKNKNNLQYINE